MRKMSVDIEEIATKLINALEKNPELRQRMQKIILRDYTKKDEPELLKTIYAMLQELKALRIDMNKRFEAMDKRFEAMDKRFEAMDKRFEQLIAELHQHIEESAKRFEAIDKRFEALNKRLDNQQGMLEKLDRKMTELHSFLGGSLESLVRSLVFKILYEKGYENAQIRQNVTFIDEARKVHPDSTYVEVDLFCENPLVVVEVTGILKDLKKIEIFKRKVQFLREKYPNSPLGMLAFVTTEIKEDIIPRAVTELKKIQAELITKAEVQKRVKELGLD